MSAFLNRLMALLRVASQKPATLRRNMPGLLARISVAACCLACPQAVLFAADVAGIKVEETVRVGPAELVLNGAGVRTRLLFKVYVAALYLPAKKKSAAEVIGLQGPRRVSLRLLRKLTAEQLIEALEDGIQANTGPAERENLQLRLGRMRTMMMTVKEGREGDVITLDFLPGSGTQATLNGTALGAPIPGDDFYAALLRIWLGDEPVSKDLKNAMLGQPE